MPDRSDSLDVYLEIADVIIVVLDRQARIQRINRKGAEVLGYESAAALEGRDWFETAIRPDHRDHMRTVFHAVLAGDGASPHRYENEVITATGQVRLIEWRNTMLRDGDGRITGTLSSGTDVTERRAIEDELRRAEHRQRYLLALEASLRDAPTARDAVTAACKALGHELGAIFVGVGELQADEEHTVVQSEWRKADTIPSTIGRHHQPSAGAERFAAMLRGEIVTVRDVRTDPRTADIMAQEAYAAFGARASLDIPLMRAGKARALMFVADDQPRDWSFDDISIAQETLDRAWHAAERARAEAALANSESRLRAILDSLPIGVVLGEAPSGMITFANRATETIFGHPPIASPDTEAYREWESYHADGARVAGAEYPLAKVLQTGRPAEGDYHYRRGDGSMRWVRIAGASIRDEHDQLIAGVVGIIDIDEQVRLLDHQRVLVAELSHRVKNVLAVVQAMALQTLSRAGSLEDFRAAFEGRLQALAAAHSLLLKSNWSSVSMQALVELVLAPFGSRGDTVSVSGQEFELSVRQGIALALILHELATNAVKYGALANSGARLEISWAIDKGCGRVELHWQERDLLSAPVMGSEGFGTRLIRRCVSNDLRGTATRQTGASFLTWQLVFPLETDSNPHIAKEIGRGERESVLP